MQFPEIGLWRDLRDRIKAAAGYIYIYIYIHMSHVHISIIYTGATFCLPGAHLLGAASDLSGLVLAARLFLLAFEMPAAKWHVRF